METQIEKDLKIIFKNRCRSLCNLYDNNWFWKLHESATRALSQYEGKQDPVAFSVVLKQLKEFGFFLTPRMWTRLELLLLICILISSDLQYLHINQKIGQEETQNRSCSYCMCDVCASDIMLRAMACLPVRVQRVIYQRLKQFNCVPKDHPEALQDYGGVCICSGGCYKSLCDWFYAQSSLFKADFTADEHPFIFEVRNAPDVLLANGPYLKTTDVFNSYPVYAQLNKKVLIGQSTL
jgi:hypothetical protein